MPLRRLRQLLPDAASARGRILAGTAWTLSERFIVLLVSFGVSVVVANHLGVTDFGRLTFTVALVTLFATLVTGGLSGLVVRDLVRQPGQRYEILGTVFVIRLVAGLGSLALLLGSTLFFAPVGADGRVLAAIIGMGLCFKATEVVEFWFQSQTQLRYVSLATLGGVLVAGAVRLGLVATDASLVAFAWAIALEQVLSSLLLLLAYRLTVGPVRIWRFEAGRARAYLSQSWPLILSGVASTLNLRVDQVLLGTMIGASAVGTYAVAARLSEVWFFVPTAIANVAFPAIIRAKDLGERVYRQRLQQLYALFIWGAIAVAILVSFLGGPLIDALYSEQYSGATAVLVIHVWTAPFLFMGVVFSKWLIIEGLLMTSLVRHSFGAVLNIVLNLILIPRHGPVGSAVATLISYAAATYGACFLRRKTWPAGVDMTLGLVLPLRLSFAFISRRTPWSRTL
jgi:O-antigen/teichoic acid export membrane protein